MNAAPPSTSDLLEALTLLPENDFQRLICRAAVRRHPPASVLSERESELLLRINEPPAHEWRDALQRLREQGATRPLTVAEEEELEDVVGKLEDHAADRLRHLIELAGIRGVSLDDLMKSLGLTRVSHG